MSNSNLSSSLFRTKVQLRYDSLSAWNDADPILLRGEYAAVYDENGVVKIKIGNGQLKFKELPWASNGGGGASEACHYQTSIYLSNYVSADYDVSALFHETFPEAVAKNDDLFIVNKITDESNRLFDGYVYDNKSWMTMYIQKTQNNLPIATKSSLGVVQAGNHIAIDNGIISISPGILTQIATNTDKISNLETKVESSIKYGEDGKVVISSDIILSGNSLMSLIGEVANHGAAIESIQADLSDVQCGLGYVQSEISDIQGRIGEIGNIEISAENGLSGGGTLIDNVIRIGHSSIGKSIKKTKHKFVTAVSVDNYGHVTGGESLSIELDDLSCLDRSIEWVCGSSEEDDEE